MAPTIYCVRHAQGFHNLGAEFHSLPDPRLTPLGEEQCEKLRTTHFSDQSEISLVTASPLIRTLHTAFLTFQPALIGNESSQPQILAIPDAQETSNYPCDTGSDLNVLQGFVKEQGWPVDLSLLSEDWNVKTTTSRYSPDSNAIKARAKAARKLIRQKAEELVVAGNPDPQIVLVSHGGYLHYFTEDWEDAWAQNGTGWKNCETRAYQFVDSTNGDEAARLVETTRSRAKRGLHYPMPGREEQERLFEEAMEEWGREGLQRPDRLNMPEAETAATETEKVAGPSLDMEAPRVKASA